MSRPGSCMHNDADSYFHLSCSANRASIDANGLVINKPGVLDDEPTGHLYFLANPYANSQFLAGTYQQKFKQLKWLELIVCMVRAECEKRGDGHMDMWLVYDDENDIVPHREPGLAANGEFMCDTNIPRANMQLIQGRWPPIFNPSGSLCDEMTAVGQSKKPKRSLSPESRRSPKTRKRRQNNSPMEDHPSLPLSDMGSPALSDLSLSLSLSPMDDAPMLDPLTEAQIEADFSETLNQLSGVGEGYRIRRPRAKKKAKKTKKTHKRVIAKKKSRRKARC